MSEYYYPFDTGAGASVTQDLWSAMAKYWYRPGVPGDKNGNNLKVSATGSGLTTQVNAGETPFLGFFYINDAPIAVTHTGNSSGLPRIDTVVLRLEMDTDQVFVKTTAVAGTPSATPTPLPIVGNYETMTSRTYEMPLAYVRVESGATSITSDKIVDARWAGEVDVTTGTSLTRPDYSTRWKPAGSMHYEYDTRRWMGWDGFKWGVVAEFGPWRTWTPQVSFQEGTGAAPIDSNWTTYGRYRLLADNTCAYNIYVKTNHSFSDSGTAPAMRISLPFVSAAYGSGHDNMVTFHWQNGTDGADMRIGIGAIWPSSQHINRLYLQGASSGNLDQWTNNSVMPAGSFARLSGVYEIDGV